VGLRRGVLFDALPSNPASPLGTQADSRARVPSCVQPRMTSAIRHWSQVFFANQAPISLPSRWPSAFDLTQRADCVAQRNAVWLCAPFFSGQPFVACADVPKAKNAPVPGLIAKHEYRPASGAHVSRSGTEVPHIPRRCAVGARLVGHSASGFATHSRTRSRPRLRVNMSLVASSLLSASADARRVRSRLHTVALQTSGHYQNCRFFHLALPFHGSLAFVLTHSGSCNS